MGFGDPEHEHPLRRQWPPQEGVVCFRCVMPPSEREPPMSDRGYSCTRCNFFTHNLCAELPLTMSHPVHGEHPLTLLAAPPSNHGTTICDDCSDSCVGYIYHCETCQFNLHLKCFLTFKTEGHHHPLHLCKMETMYTFAYNCKACGYPVDGFTFGCNSCEFFLHHECAFLPPTVKHHHRHVLTLIYTFPEESDQFYCDVCEEEAGPPRQDMYYWRGGKAKEKQTSGSSRSLYYYYCISCDYIAHVFCVTKVTKITKLNEEEKGALLEHFSHQHPLSFSRKAKDFGIYCSACSRVIWDHHYSCAKCDYALHKSCAEFPPLIKHQLHEHSLALCATAPHNDGGPVMCSSCDREIGKFNFHCADCKFTLHLECACTFLHPSHEHNIRFGVEPPYSTGKFRCDACGELGQGLSMHCTLTCDFDLHQECFSLPGSVTHECHPHPLALASSPTLVSGKTHCDVCDNEADPELWIYYCKECNYIAHLSCVASDFLRSRRTSHIQPDFCTIFSCEEASMKAPEIPSLCFDLSHGYSLPLRPCIPLFIDPDAMNLMANENDDEQPVIPNITDLAIKEISDLQNSTTSVHWSSSGFQHCSHQHALTLMDGETSDEVYCVVCKLVIFPPAYSCAECQIFLHKSCAEIPHNFTNHPGHTFTLISPPFDDALSTCKFCKNPITSFAYHCATCQVILDVQCAFGVPILKHRHHKHHFFCMRLASLACRACGDRIGGGGVPNFNCGQVRCECTLHAKCALLPYTITHRIHRHSLALTWDLDTSDEFYCDVCENEVDPKLWAYHCASCDASDHVSCVTSTKCIVQDCAGSQDVSEASGGEDKTSS